MKGSACAFVVLCSTAVLGCGEGDDALMKPGQDCMRCHDGSGEAPRWTVAGTLFSCAEADTGAGQAGVAIVITDDSGTEVTRMTSNAAGNFYTSAQVPSPFRAYVERNGTKLEMGEAPSTGACNSCHTVPSNGGAPGRLFIDGAACTALPSSDVPGDPGADSAAP